MRHGRWAIVAGMPLLLRGGPAARADHQRDNVPAGLDETLESAHFVLRSDTHDAQHPYSDADAQALRDDFEESHSKVVAGAGGTPKAQKDSARA